MRETEGREHLKSFEVERAATSDEIMHLLKCGRCAGLVIAYAETGEVTPLAQFPRED